LGKGNNSSKTDEAEEAQIIKFLSKKEGAFPENKLIETLFGIKMNDDDFPNSEQDAKQLQRVRNTLRRLVASKQIYASVQEDPNTHEETVNYSSKGFFATP
jgi:hypothetical protein